jgi:anti-sigma regulatory factor (Ser/Thr protein kinase)
MGMPQKASFPAKEAEAVTLAATTNAVPLARRLVTEVARHWRLPKEFAEDAELVISELTTNAVKQTKYFNEARGLKEMGHIRLRLCWTLPRLFTEVWDINPLLPVRRSAAEEDTGGRGLGIVEFVCEQWAAFHCREGGKIVRAEQKLRIAEKDLVNATE